MQIRAPGKINLYLQVCGRRGDGYHLIDSLMAPLAVHDVVEVAPAEKLTLEIIGGDTLAQEPAERNLVYRAALLLQGMLPTKPGARMVLHKHLPVAAGLGGGSSDAAAVLKGLLPLWHKELSRKKWLKLTEELGADVPFFIDAVPQYVGGIGEALSPVQLPEVPVLLVNPRIAVPTAEVFRRGIKNCSGPASKRERFSDVWELADYLAPLSNDLTENAVDMAPVIAEIIAAIGETEGCLLSRMSGSGATCFGLYETMEAAQKAVNRFPDYWAVATHIPA